MKSAIERECYKLIQMVAVKQRPVCIWTGQPSTVGHHLFKRDRLATAFLPAAVWGMSDSQHHWAHKHPSQWKDIVIHIIGFPEYARLRTLSWTVVENINFEEIRNNLKKMLDKGKEV